MKITENCIVNNMPEDVYHNDPTPALEGFKDSCALSSSVARAIVEETEVEARQKIDRLNPQKERDSKSSAMELGNLAHDHILLGGESLYEIAPFDAWRSNDAKAAKADIESRGKIALNTNTAKIIDDVKAMETALKKHIAEHKDWPDLFSGGGQAEQSGFAFDGTIWNRARFDWIPSAYENVIVDYKTTGKSFEQWEKNELWGGYFYQEHHYRRVWDMISDAGAEPSQFLFVVQQTFEPYLVDIFMIDDGWRDAVTGRYERAYQKFVNCTKTGIWRGRSPYTKHSYPPAWVEQRWEHDVLQDDIEKKLLEDEQGGDKPDEIMAVA